MANFLKVQCEKCNNEQVVFTRSATPVKCLICGETLLISAGGNAKVSAKVIENY